MKLDRRERYRERQKAQGIREVLMRLPTETVDQIDALQQTGGYVNRSAALLALIRKGLEGMTQQPAA